MADTLAQHTARLDAESAETDAYLDWCAERDLDPDADHWDSFRADRRDTLDAHLESVAEDRAGRVLDPWRW